MMTSGRESKWRSWFRGSRPVVPPRPELPLDLDGIARTDFPDEYPAARSAVDQVLAAIDGQDLSVLAAHSPALAGYNWSAYVRCSLLRAVRVLRGLGVPAR